jgi:hypothetical protein
MGHDVGSAMELREQRSKISKLNFGQNAIVNERTIQESQDKLPGDAQQGHISSGQSSWGLQDKDPWSTNTADESADFWACGDVEKPIEEKPTGVVLSDLPHVGDVQDCCGKLNNQMDLVGNQSIPDESIQMTEIDSVQETTDCGCDKTTPIIMSPSNFVVKNTPITSHDQSGDIGPTKHHPDQQSGDTGPTKHHSDLQQGDNLDKRCLSDEEDGNLLVVNDTDDSDVDVAMDTRLPWQPVVKREPYSIQEHLQLSMEEVNKAIIMVIKITQASSLNYYCIQFIVINRQKHLLC